MIRFRFRIRPVLYTGMLGLLILLSRLTLPAQNAPLTLKQCISIALNDNPLIRSSQHQYQAALARVNQAKAFSQPTLNIDSDLQPDPFDIRNSGESYIGVGKSVLFPGKRRINTAIASKASDEILMEAELLKLDLVYRVKLAFYTLMLNQEQLGYAKKDFNLAKDFLDKTKVKFDAGDAAQVEVLRAQVEVAKATSEIKKISNKIIQTKGDINYLMGRDKNNPLEITGEMKQPVVLLNLDDLKRQALQNRPEIKRMNYSLEKESLIKKQAGFSYLPDFDLGFSRHTIVGESKTWDMTVALPIPLFFTQSVKGKIAEAKANYQSLQSELKNLQNAIGLEVENAYRNAVTAKNMINLFDQDMLTQSEEVYNLLLFSYQEGAISGIELIEARKTLIETRKSYAEALFNYDAAIVSIEKSIGQSLENK
ncbi:MAG: TolC family protein [Bacteroidales bacterium]|nr:TolC family protein [Bacteroidales bacterium]